MVIQVHVIDKKLTLSIKGIRRLKLNGWGRIYHVNINQKKMEVAMLSSDRADFTARKVVRQRRVLAFVQLPSHVWLFATLWLKHAGLLCPWLSPGVCWNSFPLSRWCHPTFSSSVSPFSSCPQSFPASRSFPRSQLFASSGQSIGASALASVLPLNIQGWFPLGLTRWISLLSKGLSRDFSSTTVQKHQFFGAQPSFWSNSNIRTWLLGKP